MAVHAFDHRLVADAEAEQEAAQEALTELEQVENAIQVDAEQQGFGDKVAFRFEGRGLVLSILNSAVLFDSGQASLRPEGLAVLDSVRAEFGLAPDAEVTTEANPETVDLGDRAVPEAP